MVPRALRGLASPAHPAARGLAALCRGVWSPGPEARHDPAGCLCRLNALSPGDGRLSMGAEQGQTPGRRSCAARNASSSSLLCNTSSYLRNASNGAEVFLVGTAHISKKSAEEVKDTIRFVKPDVVMVELCQERAMRLRSGQASTFKDLLAIFMRPLTERGFDPGRFGASLTELFLKSFYKYLQALGMDPGLEFKVAVEEGERRGARIVYGDVPIKTTMGRIASTFTPMEVVKLLTSPFLAKQPSSEVRELFENMGNIESVVEGMKRRVVVRSMQRWMAELHPNLTQVLIHERDQYMVKQLRNLEGRVVAVVGLGHLDGIERLWEDAEFSNSRSPVPADHPV